MKFTTGTIAALLLLSANHAIAAPAASSVLADPEGDNPGDYLQCVPYAREVSGIQIYGDAWTWWHKAAGRYQRGSTPRAGAVMSFKPYGAMRLGHVAEVSKVIDSRTVLLRHANWSPIDGRRGQIEDDVRAVDVSPNNDWSEVRVWFAPIHALGTTHWPINGFIYPRRVHQLGDGPTVLASNDTPRRAAARGGRSLIGPDFLKGIKPEVPVYRAVARRNLSMTYASARSPVRRPVAARPRGPDPIGRLIAMASR